MFICETSQKNHLRTFTFGDRNFETKNRFRGGGIFSQKSPLLPQPSLKQISSNSIFKTLSLCHLQREFHYRQVFYSVKCNFYIVNGKEKCPSNHFPNRLFEKFECVKNSKIRVLTSK